MDINGVPILPANPQSTGSAATLADTFDNFLLLLTTQLQNQDPLSPLDTNQFTEQLVQFAGVEQSISTNQKLDQLIGLQGSNQLTAALDYIGKSVAVEGPGINLENGAATLTYELAGPAEQVAITIRDAGGRPVKVLTASGATGSQRVAWDGTNSAGDALPDGLYDFTVTALNSRGDTVPFRQGSIGRVSGLELVEGEVILSLGALQVPLDRVTAVQTSTDPEEAA